MSKLKDITVSVGGHYELVTVVLSRLRGLGYVGDLRRENCDFIGTRDGNIVVAIDPHDNTVLDIYEFFSMGDADFNGADATALHLRSMSCMLTHNLTSTENVIAELSELVEFGCTWESSERIWVFWYAPLDGSSPCEFQINNLYKGVCRLLDELIDSCER